MTTKLYCYVDESWHGARRETLIVAVIVTEGEQDEYKTACEFMEQASGKRADKWTRAGYGQRVAYIQRVLDAPLFSGRLCFAVHPASTAYPVTVAQTIAAALASMGAGDYRATVWIDALSRKGETEVRKQLHDLGTKVRKVRGVQRDEHNALIRLADALAGLVRAAAEGQPAMRELLAYGMARGVIKDMGQK